MSSATAHEIALPKGARAVMNRRLDPADSLDFFPTPPWATRALTAHVITDASGSCWDGCAGEGHMAEVLRERFDRVHASDIHDYSFPGASDAHASPSARASAPGASYPRFRLDAVGSFAGRTDVPQARATCPFTPDWIVMNPPFNQAVEFVFAALGGPHAARRGVALLLRSNWAEGAQRYQDLFRTCPPSLIAQFAERVPMVKDYWDPEGSTATSYAWFVWDRARPSGETNFVWIPPGCRQRLTKPGDLARFAPWTLEPPATDDELAEACRLIKEGARRAALREALGASNDRVTRIVHTIKRRKLLEVE